MRPLNAIITAVIWITLIQAPAAGAVTLGQIDDFEDGTNQNWVVALLGASHPTPPINVPTGGPAGVDDNYLLLNSIGGAGAGSKLSVINLVQWTGDFIAAGVTSIKMDVNNFGSSELLLRLVFADPLAGPPTNLAFSQNAVFLPPGSGWTSVVFPIMAADLSAGLGDVTTALKNSTEMRIYHSQSPVFPGEAIAAQLGVDNITAVPAPATIILFSSGVLAMIFRKRA